MLYRKILYSIFFVIKTPLSAFLRSGAVVDLMRVELTTPAMRMQYSPN